MSKTNGIDKRRFHSFLIYIVVLCLFYGCAGKTSVDMSAKEAESIPLIEDGKVDLLASKAVTEEPSGIKSSLRAVESKTDQPEIIQREKEYTEAEPRIFVKPTSTKNGQVLGIDFSMLPKGKSRLTVTCNKEVSYDLDRNNNTLSLNIHESTIGELLRKEIDTSEFQTALERIKPVFDKKNNRVTLEITMREIVPYHIKHVENRITMDFGRIKSKIAEKKIVPLNLVEGETKTLAVTHKNKIPALTNEKKYTGAIIGTLEFDNADVTHILRIINEITKENIIWDPAIKGKKVSMILEDAQWDEALELTLMLTDLAKRYVGPNTILVTTNQKMTKMLNDEESAANKKLQKLEAERKKQEEKNKKAVDEAPLKTEYLPVDFSTAEEMEGLINLSNRGTIRINPRTNIIIINDTAASIEAAKMTIAKSDIPEKQIMIEAKIVDVTDNFSRDFGLKWNSMSSGWRQNIGTTTVPGDATTFTTPGERVYGGSFSTNAPQDWSGNVDLNFARLTSSGLGAITLDASLALAESEGTAKIISSPKVIATNHEEALISRGTEFYPPPSENVARDTIKGELSLTVTPHASPNNYITLDVLVEDRTANVESSSGKKIRTKLIVKSGDTFVLGGIYTENNSDLTDGVPFLKDIPGLGWLFKAKRKTAIKTELLIFITATVLPPLVKDH